MSGNTKESQFNDSITYLLSIRQGLLRSKNIEMEPYRRGYLDAVAIWDSADDSREGFRRVVRAEQNGKIDGMSPEYKDGYTDALLMFQEAKGL